eukprot:1143774-Pelagomonas_calceolata.AAC.9
MPVTSHMPSDTGLNLKTKGLCLLPAKHPNMALLPAQTDRAYYLDEVGAFNARAAKPSSRGGRSAAMPWPSVHPCAVCHDQKICLMHVRLECWHTRASTALLPVDQSLYLDKIGALHARATWLCAHHEGPVSAGKDLVGVDADGHLQR